MLICDAKTCDLFHPDLEKTLLTVPKSASLGDQLIYRRIDFLNVAELKLNEHPEMQLQCCPAQQSPRQQPMYQQHKNQLKAIATVPSFPTDPVQPVSSKKSAHQQLRCNSDARNLKENVMLIWTDVCGSLKADNLLK